MSNTDFTYDVFLSHSAKDNVVVREIAARLEADGVRVWFDEREIRPGDSIFAKIEEGLERSRVLVLCMSAHAFGSDWTQIESGTFRFRDPANRARRLIPLRLDEAPIRGSLAQFLYIDYLPDQRSQGYATLLNACRPLGGATTASEVGVDRGAKPASRTKLKGAEGVKSYHFSDDGRLVLTACADKTVRVWELETGHCRQVLAGHARPPWCAVWSPDRTRCLSGSSDRTIRLWDLETGECVRVLQMDRGSVYDIAWSTDQQRCLSASSDGAIWLWDLTTGEQTQGFPDEGGAVFSVEWSADERRVLSAHDDGTLRLWDLRSGKVLTTLVGHTRPAYSVALSADEQWAASSSGDQTVRVWDLASGYCARVFEGHTASISHVSWSLDQRELISVSDDRSARVWEVGTGHCVRVLKGHDSMIVAARYLADGRSIVTGDFSGAVLTWELPDSEESRETRSSGRTGAAAATSQVQYTNAKVLLVGESGVGKTGLSRRLALNEWQPSDSTVGAWATQWKLPVSSEDGIEREIWLWDFGGQADQRLIHQLYMDEAAMAVLVFDGQKDDLFETLGQWDRDLMHASQKDFEKLLVAGRVDAGGVRASRAHLESFREERGYLAVIETSAKANVGCEDLKEAILEGIRWANIPWRSSPLLFKKLKDQIIRLRDDGRVLMRFNELREALQLRMADETARFTDDELKAVVGLLASPGVVWELKFGSWILLQPERINAYAQAVIQTAREDVHERGCLAEHRVLDGALSYQSSMARLDPDEERFVLLAMHQTLVERGLCLRQYTEKGALLIFPSYYRRERPDLVGHPAVLVSYRFTGFLDDIYATLVVRLHHTQPFEQHQLWRYAADFKTLAGRSLGVKLTRRSEGAGELEVYFDPLVDVGEKIVFSKYVHEHLLQAARDVSRFRHYVCPDCATPVGNREVAMERLDEWLRDGGSDRSVMGRLKSSMKRAPTIVCSKCEGRVPLWDDLEQSFASPEIQERVRELQQASATVIDNESKERAFVGDVISTVALAGQLCREKPVSEHGIDMEIELTDDVGNRVGELLLLQLKSDPLPIHGRRSGGVQDLIRNLPDVDHWIKQRFPVFLVVRSATGEPRWMEVRDILQQHGESGREFMSLPITFKGERLDVMSVRRWRERILGTREG